MLALRESLDCSKESISELKRLKMILRFAEQLLVTSGDLAAESKESMRKFLRTSLVYKQDLRVPVDLILWDDQVADTGA